MMIPMKKDIAFISVQILNKNNYLLLFTISRMRNEKTYEIVADCRQYQMFRNIASVKNQIS